MMMWELALRSSHFVQTSPFVAMNTVFAICLFACLCLTVYSDSYGNGNMAMSANNYLYDNPSPYNNVFQNAFASWYPNNDKLSGQYVVGNNQFSGAKMSSMIQPTIGGASFHGYRNNGLQAVMPVMPLYPSHRYGAATQGFAGGFDPYYVDPRPGIPETLSYLADRSGEFVKRHWPSK